jgi:hypothetical protein
LLANAAECVKVISADALELYDAVTQDEAALCLSEAALMPMARLAANRPLALCAGGILKRDFVVNFHAYYDT